VVALYWFVWFRPSKVQQQQRAEILAALFAALVGLAMASGAVLVLP
jgi:CHASE1-domain containing sensor protein